MDNNRYTVDAMRDAVKAARELENRLIGALEGLGATVYSDSLIAEIRGAAQTGTRQRERIERLAAKVERAYDRHEAQEERREAGEVYEDEEA